MNIEECLIHLNGLKSIKEASKYIYDVFGEINIEKEFNYPDDIWVKIKIGDNFIEVVATKNNVQIIGKGWRIKDKLNTTKIY